MAKQAVSTGRNLKVKKRGVAKKHPNKKESTKKYVGQG